MKIPFHNGHVLGIAALSGQIFSIYLPLAFAIVLPVAAAFALAVRRLRDGRWPAPPLILVGIFAGLFLWCLISVSWSPAADVAVAKLPRFLVLILSGLVLADAALSLAADERAVFARLLIAGIVITGAMLVIERLAHAPLRRFLPGIPDDENLVWVSFSRSVTTLTLFVWPVIALLWRRWAVAAALAWASMLVVTLVYFSGAALMGFVVGSVFFVLTRFAPRATTTVFAVLLGVVVLATPFIIGNIPDLSRLKSGVEVVYVPRSTYHRLLVWKFTGERAAEHPVRGWGFESSRAIPGGEAQLDTHEVAMPLHPHNGIMQIWLELGLPGGLLTALLLVWIMLVVRRGGVDSVTRSATVALVASVLTVSSLSYGIWQSWWFSVLWLASAFAMVAWQDSKSRADGKPDPTPAAAPPP
jgi:O-antigen ligase